MDNQNVTSELQPHKFMTTIEIDAGNGKSIPAGSIGLAYGLVDFDLLFEDTQNDRLITEMKNNNIEIDFNNFQVLVDCKGNEVTFDYTLADVAEAAMKVV